MAKLYCIGVGILIIAIIANTLIGKLGILSWYDLLNKLNESGLSQLKTLHILDCLWLFIVYPIVLGFGYIVGDKLYLLMLSKKSL